MKQLKAIKKADHVAIIFGEWFDKINGNTYYDATVYIGDKTYSVPYQYGYNAGDKQAIDEALKDCGYRVRANKANPFQSYRAIKTRCVDTLKRDLIKEYSEA